MMMYDALVCSKSTLELFMDVYGGCFKETVMVAAPPTKQTLGDLGRYESVAAIGGGAVIDTAKIVGNRVFCWPTTASGSSATSHSVYWDGEKKCNCHRTPPESVKWNDIFINSLPAALYSRTKYDAISHCLDSMWSKDCTQEVDSLARETLDILLDPASTRTEVMEAGHVAGHVIEQVPTTILHALSYPMTSIYGIPHGDALGIILKPVCDLMGESDVSNKIETLLHQYTYDPDIVVEKAKDYDKFHNTTKTINANKLKEDLE
tara:strand:- start:200 stop:988 length:789 start_codon:yes stop_codon:yes gene_type:complete